MNKQDDLKQVFNLAKFWNEMLGENDSTSHNEGYFNIENYAYRFDLLMHNQKPSITGSIDSQELDKIIRNCEQIIKSQSNLDSYLQEEERKVSSYLKISRNDTNEAAQENVQMEIIDELIDDTEPSKATKSPQEKLELDKDPEVEIEQPKLADSNNQTIFSYDSQFTVENAQECFNSIKTHLIDNNHDDLKATLIDLSSKSNHQLVKLISMNLINFETFLSTEEMKASEIARKQALKESYLTALMNSLIEINAITTISYNVSCIFLKSILCDYVLVGLYNENGKDSGKILSRKMFQICTSVFKEFPRQFIYSCLMSWVIKINNDPSVKSTPAIVSTNKFLIEFVTKMIKDCFAETEALITLASLLNEFANLAWYESIYSVISCLIEKLTSLNCENLSLLLTKMKSDSANLSKSNLFSKLLINLLNKCQHIFLVQNQSVVETTSVKAVEEFINESNLYGFSQSNEQSSSQSSQQVKKPKQSRNFTRNANASHLISNLESIINNNQTLMKTTLLNMLNNFKANT
jgi:hypothetical protein